MADTAGHQYATPSNPMPELGLPGRAPPGSIAIPQSVRTMKRNNLTLDTMSPVTQNGSFEFDRIIKSGQLSKRTRKTKSWKPVFLVLRPNLLSIYRDRDESRLKHQINLSDLTAVARQKDSKRKDKHIFGLFSPSRNFHLEATSEREAQEWVELIRREARIDQDEEEMYLASPGGARSEYRGFERSIDAIATVPEERSGVYGSGGGGYSSSDMETMTAPGQSLPRQRDRGNTGLSSILSTSGRRPSHLEYSGPDYGSYSDFSDGPAARLSNLSLTYSDARPSTSSAQRPPMTNLNSVYNTSRPGLGPRSTSQLSTTSPTAPQAPEDDHRVLYNGYIFLLKSSRGVRRWSKVWAVLRPKALTLYKTEEEHEALKILQVANIIDAVEIDAISRSKTSCMQVISEERNYRFCAMDEEGLAKFLGAFKSLLNKRKMARDMGGGQVGGPVQSPPQLSGLG